IRITERRSDERYTVELSIPEWGKSWQGTTKRPFPDQRDLLRGVETYGDSLGEVLFAPDVIGKAFGDALTAVESQGGSLRVRLSVDLPDLPDLARWELLRYPDGEQSQSVAFSPRISFYRFVSGTTLEPFPLLSNKSVRALIVICSPSDLDSFRMTAI